MKWLPSFIVEWSQAKENDKETMIKLGLIFHPLDVFSTCFYVLTGVRQCRLCHYLSEVHGMHVMDFLLCYPYIVQTTVAAPASATTFHWRWHHHQSIWYVARAFMFCSVHYIKCEKQKQYSAFYVFLCLAFASNPIRFIDLWSAHSPTNPKLHNTPMYLILYISGCI